MLNNTFEFESAYKVPRRTSQYNPISSVSPRHARISASPHFFSPLNSEGVKLVYLPQFRRRIRAHWSTFPMPPSGCVQIYDPENFAATTTAANHPDGESRTVHITGVINARWEPSRKRKTGKNSHCWRAGRRGRDAHIYFRDIECAASSGGALSG